MTRKTLSMIGVDMGRAGEPSAIAVVERVEAMGELDGLVFAHRMEVQFWLRHVERAPFRRRG